MLSQWCISDSLSANHTRQWKHFPPRQTIFGTKNSTKFLEVSMQYILFYASKYSYPVRFHKKLPPQSWLQLSAALFTFLKGLVPAMILLIAWTPCLQPGRYFVQGDLWVFRSFRWWKSVVGWFECEATMMKLTNYNLRHFLISDA